ncbi:hypothetical protein EZS27_007999 [termite gut metagenome]|uniref:Transmembrane protein n=1 Tax=termite gut metagenome TaxID=433724 RepID=A0A5J4SGM2_9ZZZZ
MNPSKAKITFYAERSFAEKINVTLRFIEENWKILLKYATYVILPLCILQAIFVTFMVNGIDLQTQAAYGIVFFVNQGLAILCSIIGNVLFISLIYTLMAKYNEREECLAGFTFADLKQSLLIRAKRILLVFLFCLVVSGLVVLLLIALVAVTPLSLFLTVPLFLVCTVPLFLLIPVYMFENTGIFRAFVNAFRLGLATWWGVFIVYLLGAIIACLFSIIFSIPWTVTTVVRHIFFLSDVPSEITISTGYNLMQYLFAVIMLFGTYLSGVFVSVGLAYQYAHARKKNT